MMYLAVSILGTIVHIPSIILRYVPFKEIITKQQKKLLRVIYMITLLVNFGLYIFVQHYSNIDVSFYKFNIFIFCIILAIANAIVIRGYTREHIFVFGLTAIIIIMLFSITTYFESLYGLGYQTVEVQILINAFILCIFFGLLYPIEKNIMINTVTPFLDIKQKKYWSNICWIPIGMLFAILITFPMSEYVSTFRQLIGRLLLGISTLFMCRAISYDYVMFKEKEQLDNSLEVQKKHYTMLLEKIEETRRIRHDLKHYLTAINSYIENDDLRALKNYCLEFSNLIQLNTEILYIGNSAVDGIIYYYDCECKKNKIKMDYKGTVKDTNVLDIDLCVITGNLFDNAYTACKNYTGSRFINFMIKQEKEMLTIMMQNSFDGFVQKDKDVILSRKRNHQKGIGLESIKGICEKYGGDIKIEYKENIFGVMIVINDIKNMFKES